MSTASAPLTVSCRRQENGIFFTVVNSGTEPWEGSLVYGAFDTRGEQIFNDVAPYKAPPNSETTYGAGKRWSFLVERGLHRTGAFAVLSDDQNNIIAHHWLVFVPLHTLDLVRDPKISLSLDEEILTVKSDVFVLGVCLDGVGEGLVAYNDFDLLPGIPYHLPWDKTVLGEPRLLQTGNRDARVL